MRSPTVLACAASIVILTIAARPTPVLGQDLSFEVLPPSVSASGSELTPAPGVRLSRGNTPLAGALVTLTSDGLHLQGAVTVATDTNGVARFTGITARGKVGPYRLVFAAAGDTAQATVRITSGEPAALLVTHHPSDSTPSGKQFKESYTVQLQDSEGNAVHRPDVTVRAEPVDDTIQLLGTTEVPTDARGVATFSALSMRAPPGRYGVRFTSSGLLPDVSAPVEITHANFDSHLVIGAIKTISGLTPEAEFFDVGAVFPIWLTPDGSGWLPIDVFGMGSIDLPLSTQQAREVREAAGDTTGTAPSGTSDASEEEERLPITEASFSLNVMVPPANRGARKVFGGVLGRIFEGEFYYGFHIGAIELPSSKLHGSHLTVGRIVRTDEVPGTITNGEGAVVENPVSDDYFFFSFLLLSDTAPILSSLSVRGTILIPQHRKDGRLLTRLAVSVPIADLFQISSGS